MTSGGDGSRPLSPLVLRILNDLDSVRLGEMESAELRQHWGERLARRSDRDTVATELIVVATRLHRAGDTDGLAAMRDLLHLVAQILSADELQKALESGGMLSGEAKVLVDAARGVKQRLADGLAPPTTGLKLRKP